MAVTVTISNHFKYQKDLGLVPMDETYKMILMDDTFVFDKDTHGTLTSVASSQLATRNGYTSGGATLANPVTTEDDVLDCSTTVWDDVTWTADGGDIGPTSSAIIYHYPTSTVYCSIDFGTTYTVPDTAKFQFQLLTAKTI